MKFDEWSSSDPARIVDLRPDGALLGLLNEYGGTQPTVLSEVLAQAYALGAQMAVIEYRYLDADYRNEHSRFYSSTFRRYPSVAHRLHFFREPPPDELDDPDVPMSFQDLTYLGFSVLRPVPGAPVGRTMIAPPPGLEEFVTCLTEDRVNLFGVPLSVRAAPFVAQDAQLSVCAHATAWVTAYYHHLEFGRPRMLPGDIADVVPGEVGLGRLKPSKGLTIHQMAEALRRIGLPSLVYLAGALPPGETIFRVVCRYLNSGLPVTVAGGRHAFVLVGYEREVTPVGLERIRFIRQDDEQGPYQVVDNLLLDTYAPWQYIIVPLPEKVYLAGEDAEVLGEAKIRRALETSADPEAQQLHQILQTQPSTGPARDISFRSTVMPSNDFKAGLPDRGFPDVVTAIYQRMPMSRWIWVVEAIRRTERNEGKPCVVAEAIIDATDHLRDLHVLAWRIPKALWSWNPDEDEISYVEGLDPIPPVTSVGRMKLG